MSTTETVTQLAEPIVIGQGLDLVDVVFQKEGADWVLRVFIENREGELTLEHCEKVSKMLSAELDQEDPISQSYILEVSSPGVERPLKKPEDFRRFSGKRVAVKTYAPINGNKEFEGELVNFEDEKVIIKDEKGVMEIPFNKIANAHLTLDI